MSDELGDVVDVEDRQRLIEEISLLRGKVARLQERVEQLDQLAHQDSLINLPNRRGFMRELERLIGRVDRYGINAAMLFVDLDGLKMINDTFGHRAGDEALIQVAALLATGVRHGDIVARIGGFWSAPCSSIVPGTSGRTTLPGTALTSPLSEETSAASPTLSRDQPG